jgi:hypothetical protein
LIGGLGLLIFQIGFGLGDLGFGLALRVGVKGNIGPGLLRLDQAEQIAALDGITLLDRELLQAALDFRTDDYFIGGDNAGENNRRRQGTQEVVESAGQNGKKRDQDGYFAFHLGATGRSRDGRMRLDIPVREVFGRSCQRVKPGVL